MAMAAALIVAVTLSLGSAMLLSLLLNAPATDGQDQNLPSSNPYLPLRLQGPWNSPGTRWLTIPTNLIVPRGTIRPGRVSSRPCSRMLRDAKSS